MKNKNRIIAIVAIVLVIALMAAAFIFLRPQAQEGGKTFTVTVVHADGSEKKFTLSSDEEYLGTVLLDEKIVEGSMDQYGLYIKVVDGEQAIYEVDGAYWSLMINGEYAVTGADMTPLEDGAAYTLVYTRA